MNDDSGKREHEFTAAGWPAGEEPSENVKEVLRRTVQFLSQCVEDPRSALESEDPSELILGLESILRETPVETQALPEAEEAPPTSIHRRRRSA